MSQNTILIGPTLNEGIDLPGDKCRFIIILKVPYPQIKDRLVEAKMHLFPLWYNYTTSNQIIQGIGRGNRFKDDWCITYILDSCFFNLYMATKEQYPKELQERIKIYK
jgi:Rad3-related DNA helicase